MTNDVDRVRRIGAVGGDDEQVGTLADRVRRARGKRGLSLTDLHRLTGLSSRTLRDIEAGNPRRYSPTTLGKIDETFGWPAGTAFAAWDVRPPVEDVSASIREAIAAQMAQLRVRLERIEETPPWQTEVVDAFRLLRPEDRARLLDLARRLADSGTWR